MASLYWLRKQSETTKKEQKLVNCSMSFRLKIDGNMLFCFSYLKRREKLSQCVYLTSFWRSSNVHVKNGANSFDDHRKRVRKRVVSSQNSREKNLIVRLS